jgi:hypothetical protein
MKAIESGVEGYVPSLVGTFKLLSETQALVLRSQELRQACETRTLRTRQAIVATRARIRQSDALLGWIHEGEDLSSAPVRTRADRGRDSN